jgi:Zn-finger nucleic acid-binding protein
MEEQIVSGIQVDRCSSCFGLWFDSGEVEKLISLKAADAIDIGDPALGDLLNVYDRYDCPKCKVPMIRMVDPAQTHIWFEKCGSCYGSFFDAGEFKDLSRFTLSDIFKRFMTAERE